jgi:PAS domain-containing protein
MLTLLLLALLPTGGEFVCGPGRNVSYVHRMSNTRGHNPIKVALGYAGILNPGNFALGLEVEAGVSAGPSSKPLPGAWRAQRDGELDRMRAWREERRKGRLFREAQEARNEPIAEVNLDSDAEDGPTTPDGRRRTLNARALNGHGIGIAVDGLTTPMSVQPLARRGAAGGGP